jgi:hypothetical protein
MIAAERNRCNIMPVAAGHCATVIMLHVIIVHVIMVHCLAVQAMRVLRLRCGGRMQMMLGGMLWTRGVRCGQVLGYTLAPCGSARNESGDNRPDQAPMQYPPHAGYYTSRTRHKQMSTTASSPSPTFARSPGSARGSTEAVSGTGRPRYSACPMSRRLILPAGDN